MRVRTYLGLLLALLLIIAASYLTQQNRDVLYTEFRVNPTTTVPIWIVVLTVFLAGFLPTGTVLLAQHLRRDLAARRERKARRETQSFDAAYRRAVDAMADAQWGKAEQELAVVAQAQPEDFSVLLRQGEVLRRLGRAKEAVEIHRRASGLYPQSAALLYQLAEDYDALAQPDVAGEIRSRVLRDFPGQGVAVLRHRRNAALAASAFAEASRLQDQIEQQLREAGNTAGLEAEAGISLGLAYQRGVALLEQEKAEEAAAVFRQVLERERRFIPAAIMLGEAELLRDNPKAALAEWRRGYDATGSPVFLQRIEDYFIEVGEPVQAIELLRGIIATAQNDTLPRFFLGRLYYRLEMHEEAMKLLASVGDRVASSPTYHLLLGRLHERRGEMRRAVESYFACIRQLGVLEAGYSCRLCHASHPEWSDRCAACGSWNSVELDFQEEHLSAEQMGVRDVPAWGGHEDLPSGEFPLPESKEGA
jgi:predicted Zn-dependent protease